MTQDKTETLLTGSKAFPITKEGLEKINEKYNVRPFKEASPSKAQASTIDLDFIDLSLFKEGDENLAGRQKLAATVEKTLTTYGFLAIENHGIDIEEFEKMRSIAQSVCELPEEVQREYLGGAMKSDLEDRSKSLGAERGHGFKPKKYWAMKNGVEDSIVFYNVRNIVQSIVYDTDESRYPELVLHYLPEIVHYFRTLHNVVLKKLTILCDIILELPEGYIWKNYYEVIDGDLYNSGQGFGRMMLYEPMNKEDEKKVDNHWLRGHSDSGGFTLLTSQPILSLQIRDYFTGEWKFVGHRPGGLIVNVGDAMEFLTGGYFKAAIHRVISPPEDQRAFRRLVLIYFSGPKFSSVLDPDALNSPKLKRLGISKPEEWDTITCGEWDNVKSRLFGKKAVNSAPGDSPNLVLLYGRLHERWHQAQKDFNLEEAKKTFNIIEV
ncbi:hypothetical protein CAAN3_07S01860 [[Candida] anglica]